MRSGLSVATGQIRNLWRGESAMLACSESLPDDARFLLAPPFKCLGRRTTDIVKVDVRERDAAWQ